jgi:hypothetical protein
MDLREELDRAIGHGPGLPPPAQRLVAGRAALRRRRIAMAAGTAVAVVAVVVPAAVLTGGTPTSGRDLAPVAPPGSTGPVDPSPAPEVLAERMGEAVTEHQWQGSGVVAEVDIFTGDLVIRPGAVVTERVDDLYPGKASESVALDVRWRGERHWVALEWEESGASTGTYGSPGDGFYTDFDDFVAKATSGGGLTHGQRGRRGGAPGEDRSLEPVTLPWLTVTGQRFDAGGGAGRIVEQRADIGFPENFAPPGSPTAAALLEEDGRRYLALFRGPESELVVVDAAGHGATLDALLAWARQRYESGEGLL